ncbi:3-dehydroquinate synthase [Gracilibacillus halotolerans]|uniref:3-dehydroquinate synthase n=1 Tax=Gracilibacillus halotolerans TaxID=74386 RepID=A0A841RGP8_9BACI|nr:3-dehydroquinate synthase [Gracilibacillus halotolerans]MBB6511649.1 3-dehydroquinate synthase [Gracilibacillus halotolerans]
METVSIRTSTNQYDVVVGNGLIEQISNFLPKDYSNILVISDETVYEQYGERIKNGLGNRKIAHSIVPAGEASKNINNYYKLLTNALNQELDRKALIIALGGGMIGDLAGFVASTYMRGIDFIQVPTTILAHDSSVGGKVAINHEKGKNMIGSFYPPTAVIYDINTLRTLPQREIRSGYAEIMKHGLISSHSFFEECLNTDLTNTLSDQTLKDQLVKGIKVKADIVQRDEKESNIRKFLNFGHTLGHAIEAEAGYGNMTHGEAVAIGMLFALQLSETIYHKPMPFDSLYEWMKRNKYPVHVKGFEMSRLIKRMKMDKKAENANIQMVLLQDIGKPSVYTIDDNVLLTQLKKFAEKVG